MSDRYRVRNGQVLDRACGQTGHTMFLLDVVQELNRIAKLEAENKQLRGIINEIRQPLIQHGGFANTIAEIDKELALIVNPAELKDTP